MPCRCCSGPKPPKGLKNSDNYINQLLKEVCKEIKNEYISPYDNNKDEENAWYDAWIEAFEHHLKGCAEKNNVNLKDS